MTNPSEPTLSIPSSSTSSGPTSSGLDLRSGTSWHWRFEDSSGGPVTPPAGGLAASAGGFSSQSDAESWIGELWRELLDEGVEQVTLFEADREVYGPMSLHSTR